MTPFISSLRFQQVKILGRTLGRSTFLGDVYEDAGNLREAMTTYNNVHRHDNPVAYASAQNSAGILYKNMGAA